MSTDLRTQIEAYYDTIVDDQEPITLAEVADLADAVMPVPRPASDRTWKPIVVVAGAALSVIAILGLPFLLSGSDPVAPPATEPPVTPTTVSEPTSTLADPAPTTTVPPEEANVFGSGPFAGWTWTHAADVPGQSGMHRVDDTFFVLDSGANRAWLAERSGEDPDDPLSYYWWSTDGVDWTQVQLPALSDEPLFWAYDPKIGLLWAWIPETESANYFELAAGPDGLTLTPTESVPEIETTAVIPDMPANGLTPRASIPTGGMIGSFTTDHQVGDIVLIEGSLWFQLPQQIQEQLPQHSSGEGLGESQSAFTGGTYTAFDESGDLAYEQIWTVDGQRISVEVLLHDGEEPRSIHTGWVEVPDDFVLINTGHFGMGDGYNVDILWRSEDGGETFVPTQPQLIKEFDPFQPGRFMIDFQDRFLWYFEIAADEPTPWVEIWSSSDGLTWIQEPIDPVFFETWNIVEATGRLYAPGGPLGLFTSLDGVTWETMSRPPGTDNLSAWGDAVVVSGGGAIHVLTDGLEWHEIAIPDGVLASRGAWYPTYMDGWILLNHYSDNAYWIGQLP